MKNDFRKSISITYIEEVKKKLQNPRTGVGLRSRTRRSIATDFKLVMEELDNTITKIRYTNKKLKKSKSQTTLRRYAFISKGS